MIGSSSDLKEVSKAKYVVEQYVAAIGGVQAVTTAAGSMCAVGNVWMTTAKGHNKSAFKTGMLHGDVAGGGFVLWQKTPELWCVEMLVSGSSGAKMSAGSNGKVAWRQARGRKLAPRLGRLGRSAGASR